jgi:hypothetical protein
MPTPVSTGSLTIADLNDGLYALLSSETGLVHCDSAGTPTTPLTTTPLTTMMTVYKGNSVQTGFSFTRTASSGVTSAVNASGVLSVTGLTVGVDSGWVDITASKSGEPSITKRYVISKVKQGIQGPAGTSITSVDVEYAISTSNITAPTTGWSTTSPAWEDGKYLWARTKTTYSVGEPTYTNPACITGGKGETGDPGQLLGLNADTNIIGVQVRGSELITQQIVFTLSGRDVVLSDVDWVRSDYGNPEEGFEYVYDALGEIDYTQRYIDCSTVLNDNISVSVSYVSGTQVLTSSVTISKILVGTAQPIYLEATDTIPIITEEGALIEGDFFLYVGPYSGPNSDPGDQGLNPAVAETNEFIYGRIYEYKGKDSGGVDQWDESRKSEHFSAAQKDALEIAKNSGVYLYAAVVVAQLGLFMDLIFSGSLMSADYIEYTSAQIGTVVDGHLVTEEDVALKRPYKGIYMDGNKGLIKLLSLMVKDIDAFGFLTSSGFRTLRGEDGQTIGVSTVSPTLWKHSEMEALIASQDTLATLSGTIEGYSFTRASRRTNQRILLASHGYESEEISAGEVHYFTRLYPSKVFSNSTFYCEYKGYYDGYASERLYCGYIRDDEQQIGEHLGVSYTVAKTYSFAIPRDGHPVYPSFRILHKSAALWGNRGSHVDYHKVWTNQVFSGLVLVNGETSYEVIAPEPSAYYPNTKTWTIGSYNQNSIDNYCSGTDFYNLFSGLAVGADGFCDGGQIRVNGTLYTVTRLTKNANSITFYTSGGVVTVDKFQEGTSVGVYTSLAVTQAINFQAVAGGIETKHIFPWGTQAGTPGSYDIGTNDERFNTAYLSGANIKPAGQSVGMSPLLTKSLNGYPGMVHSDGTDSNWLRTPLNGLIPYASGGASALGTSSWPFNSGYFKNLNVTESISVSVTAGTYTVFSRLETQTVVPTSFTKYFECRLWYSGTINVMFTMKIPSGSGSSYFRARVYVNGVAVGTERIISSGSTTFSNTISIVSGDKVQVYARRVGTALTCEISGIKVNTAQYGVE